jgi:hypothetical protein
MIGIAVFPPTVQEIETRLCHVSPAQYTAFTKIVQEMSEVIESPMVKMKISADGKLSNCTNVLSFGSRWLFMVHKTSALLTMRDCHQPTWTTDPPERAKWEWRRVKRSLSPKDRRNAIDDLQRRNIALRNCFEQQELSSATAPTQPIEFLQKHFNPDLCNTVRDHVLAIHRALRSGWNCNCVLPHQAALDLQWHANHGAIQANQRFDLSLLYPAKSPCASNNTCSDLWYKTNMWVVEEEATLSSTGESGEIQSTRDHGSQSS